MVSSVYWEWEFLLLSIRMGIRLALLYDGIKVFRMLICHRNFCLSLEDLIFWSYATVQIFRMQLEQSDGVLRGFSVLGMLLGMALYNKLLGEFLLRLAEKGILLGKRQLTGLKKLFKIKLKKRKGIFTDHRRKDGKEKDSGKEKETEQSGNAVGDHGSAGHDGSGCSE